MEIREALTELCDAFNAHDLGRSSIMSRDLNTADLKTSSQAGLISEWTASTCRSEPARAPRREFNLERVL
jgi:hypothetical protein